MSNTGGFQTQVVDQPAIGVPGNRFSSNPIYTWDAGPGGLVAGAGPVGSPAINGVLIGRFAWTYPPEDPNDADTVVQNFGSGAPAGFVPNDIQGSNPTFLSYAGNAILPGFAMYLIIAGDYLVANGGTNTVVSGMKAYANYADGSVTFAAAGAPTTGASATGSSIAAGTASWTGSITDDIMTVTGGITGTVYPGQTLSGTGVTTGTKVLSQIDGTAGGAGRYYVSNPGQAAASTTISATYGILTVGTLTTTGPFLPNDVLNATGSVVAGTRVWANITGAGGSAATMVVDNNTVVSSQTISAVLNIETKWYARSGGGPGAVIKMSSTPLGGAVPS